MSKHTDNIKLKLAWQTAYELRTCPDSETLFASQPDENLQRHLDICHLCREKREMQQDEQSAWSALRGKFASLAMTPGSGSDKQAGQVWTINSKFGGWREDGRFMKPPAVLLLEKIESTSGWKVSQLYSDKRLMSGGDVALNESFGFAQSWNCYSLKDDRFDKFLGAVKPEELKQVLAASVAAHEPAAEGSILSFFRSMEIEVGAFVAVTAVEELVDEWEEALQPATVYGVLENMFGSFSDIYNELKDKYKMPRLPDTIGDLFWGASEPAFATALSMSSATDTEYVNIVSKTLDGKIHIQTVKAKIKYRYRPDNTYFIEGELLDEFPTGLRLLAWLSYDNNLIAESIAPLENDSPYISFKFCNVPKEACEPKNVKFFLVTP